MTMAAFMIINANIFIKILLKQTLKKKGIRYMSYTV